MYANYYAINIVCKRNYKNNGKVMDQNLKFLQHLFVYINKSLFIQSYWREDKRHILIIDKCFHQKDASFSNINLDLSKVKLKEPTFLWFLIFYECRRYFRIFFNAVLLDRL